MDNSIQCTNCNELGRFTEELMRLSKLGIAPADHANPEHLLPGEFIVSISDDDRSPGQVLLYYRE